MLNKNKIDKRLKNYIKEHLSKGYSKQAVKNVLVNHGYDGSYADGLLRKHSELQFVRVYTILISLLFLVSIFSFNLISINNQTQKVTGYVTVISSEGEGCCTSICQQTSKDECYGKFVDNKRCNELEDCKVGCCIDKEGYCLTNYLYGNCINGYGISINKDCSDITFCRNITDKSYAARLHNIKNTKVVGIPMLKPPADYYGSSFNIRYYIYDKTNVLSVAANIKDANQIIDSVTLYDDGSHNDGAKNDNLYGNNWLSSKINSFDGFKRLDVDIIVKYQEGRQQAMNNTHIIVVLNNNKCLPIYNEWSNPNEKRSIIFAAQNYGNLSDGNQKFETDVQNFLNTLFSIDKFLSNKANFNIYRLEQSLSYFNIPTLVSIASNSCPSYNKNKDLIVVLDNNEDYCISESEKVARVHPQVLFSKNITAAEINDIFADFCKYILTPKQFANNIINFATPPKIIVHTLDNITYNVSDVNLSFTISAINYPVNSSVFLEDSLISTKISNEEFTDNSILKLTNGANVVLISATDKNENEAFAQVLLNVTIK